jgi:putrescine importer
MTDAIITSEIKLKRVSLNDLIIYGIILIQPVAVLPLFSHANNISQGHAVTSILVAMVAMIFTAISYRLIYLINQKTGVLCQVQGRLVAPRALVWVMPILL